MLFKKTMTGGVGYTAKVKAGCTHTFYTSILHSEPGNLAKETGR